MINRFCTQRIRIAAPRECMIRSIETITVDTRKCDWTPWCICNRNALVLWYSCSVFLLPNSILQLLIPTILHPNTAEPSPKPLRQFFVTFMRCVSGSVECTQIPGDLFGDEQMSSQQDPRKQFKNRVKAATTHTASKLEKNSHQISERIFPIERITCVMKEKFI